MTEAIPDGQAAPSGPPADLAAAEEHGTPRATAVSGVLLVLLSFGFRMPALLNARSTNSDAAIVGLQALHILRGEHSPYLWGSGYQTAADSYVAAAFFAAFGPSPLALMLSSLVLHVIATSFVFATLLRRTGPWLAFVVVLPLIFSPASVHTYALYPPRQLSITLALMAFWAVDGAGEQLAEKARPWLVGGGLLFGLALTADPYPLVLAPVLLAYVVLVSFPPGSPLGQAMGAVLSRGGSFVGAFIIGIIPLMKLRLSGHANDGPLGLSLHVIKHNAAILWHECLPWALSYHVYTAHDPSHYVPWEAPFYVQALQLMGAFSVGAIVLAGLGAIRERTLSWPVRRAGLMGATGWLVTIAGFLVSVMVMDHFSMRYLATLTLLLPLAALPAARMLRVWRFAAVLAPHVISAAICGWLGYGPFVKGFRPVAELPEIREDYALLDSLKSRGIKYAAADYWAAYRLTLLFNEELVVVPNNEREDRYAPYRRAFEAAPMFAYIYDRGRSREDLVATERELVTENARVEKADIGTLTVFVVTRK